MNPSFVIRFDDGVQPISDVLALLGNYAQMLECLSGPELMKLRWGREDFSAYLQLELNQSHLNKLSGAITFILQHRAELAFLEVGQMIQGRDFAELQTSTGQVIEGPNQFEISFNEDQCSKVHVLCTYQAMAIISAERVQPLKAGITTGPTAALRIPATVDPLGLHFDKPEHQSLAHAARAAAAA